MSEEYEEYPDEYLDENGNPCEAEPEQKRGELKPCPFCGGMPKVNDWTLKGITDKRCFCDNEKCPVYLSKTIAIDDWNTRPIEDALNARIAELEAAQRWRVVANGELPEVYRNEDGEFIPFLVCEGDGDRPFIAMYNGINWWAGIFVPDVTHWMPLPALPEVK